MQKYAPNFYFQSTTAPNRNSEEATANSEMNIHHCLISEWEALESTSGTIEAADIPLE
ncbi:MAG: hypothetical protein L7S62_04220 [Flavobacteriales bacterium]|nr:hypothetical protein [Flavobacteriales bacterium]